VTGVASTPDFPNRIFSLTTDTFCGIINHVAITKLHSFFRYTAERGCSLTIGIGFQRSQWSLCKTNSKNSRYIWQSFRYRPKETKTSRSRAGIARIDACGEGSSLVSPISPSVKQEAPSELPVQEG